MKPQSGVWWRSLAISVLLHFFVLAALSCFIPVDYYTPQNGKAQYFLEVELAGSDTNPIGGAKLEGESPVQTMSMQTGIIETDRRNLSKSLDSDGVEVQEGNAKEKGADGGQGAVKGRGSGRGTGSGTGAATGVVQANGIGISRGPLLLSGERPDYPEKARSRGLKGTVRIKIFVKPSGSTGEVKSVDSSGFAELDETARLAVLNWQFRPALQNGQAVGAWVTLPIKFEMR